VAAFDISTSHTFGQNLVTLDLPKLLLDQPFIANIMKGFTFFRCKGVSITFRPQATPFHYGALGVHFIPWYWQITGALNYSQDYPWLLNVNPHFIDLAAQKAYEVVVPWELPVDWLNYPLSGVESGLIARVWVKAMTPLAASSENSPTSIPITVYANFIDPEVTGPIPDSTLVEAQCRRVIVDFGPDDFEAFEFSLGTTDEEIATFINQVEPQSSNAMEAHYKSSNRTHTTGDDDWDVTAMKIIGAVEKLAPLLTAMDKPNSEEVPSRVTTNNVVDLGYMTGLDLSHPLSTNPRASMPLDAKLMGGFSGKPTVSALCRTPGFLGKFNITSSQSKGDLVWSNPVDPIESYSISTGGADGFFPTFLSFVSSGFTMWRGGLKYSIFAVLSNMQSARIRITFTPSVVPVDITNHTGDILSEVYDIRSGAMVNFTVPYIATTSYKSVRRMVKPSALAAVTHGSGFKTGTLQINLISPLIQPSTVSSVSATMFVFVAGADDYECVGFQAVPMEANGAANQFMFPNVSAFAPEVEPQASLQALFKTEEFRPFKDSPSVRLEGVCHAERMDDWLAIGKRYSGVVTGVSPSTSYEQSYEFIGGPHIELTNQLSFPTCWLPLLLFRFYRGSVNRKMVITDLVNRPIQPFYRFIDDCQGTHRPLLEPVQWTQGGNTMLTNTGLNTTVAEFMIPYLCLTPFIPLEAEGIANLGNRYFSRPSRAWLNSPTGPGVATDIHLMSLGDDFQVASLLAPPMMVQASNPAGRSKSGKASTKK
jgi:hypothetical protein